MSPLTSKRLSGKYPKLILAQSLCKDLYLQK